MREAPLVEKSVLAARPGRDAATPRARRWHRALAWGSLLLLLAALGTCTLGVLRTNHAPFWTLKALADVAALMEADPSGRAPPPGLAVEGTYAHPFIPWSRARVSGLDILPAQLHDGVGRRLLAYSEEPCRAAADFGATLLPAGRAGPNAAWLAQEMRVIETAFACEGDGRLRPEHERRWRDTTFRLHLRHAGGGTMTLDIRPGWTTPRP